MIRIRLHHVASACIAVGLSLIGSGSVSAQQNSLFGAGGALGGSNGFSTGSTGINSNPLSTGGGIGGFGAVGSGGAGGTGAAGMGAGMGAQSGLGSTGMGANTAQQRSTFVGRDDTANRFVGSSVAGQQGGQQGRNGLNQRNQMNQMGRNQQGRNRGGAQNQQFMNQGNQNFGGNQGQQQQRTVRPRQKVAFTYPATTQTKLQTALNTRFDKLAKRGGFEGIEIVADGDRVILRGQVDTDDTRKLAAMLASIEPGVSSVSNELTVQTPEPPEPGE